MKEYDELIKDLRWNALNCTRVVAKNIEEDCSRAAYALEELASSNAALVISLGVSHRKINELASKLEEQILITAAHKRSQDYAFEDLAKTRAEHSYCLDLIDKLQGG